MPTTWVKTRNWTKPSVDVGMVMLLGKQVTSTPWKDSGTHWPQCYSNSYTVGGSGSGALSGLACESRPPS